MTCPPSNPISTRCASAISRSVPRWLDDLGQHAAGRSRMQEGDAAVADTDPRLAVDQLEAGGADRGQRRVDVLHRVGDVMQARALAVDELADGGVGAERPQQLDMALADIEQDRLDALRLDRLTVGELHLEALLVELDRGVEVLDGDADVIDPSETLRGGRSLCTSSARRISARAATPTSSCSAVGSLVAISRWISRPGAWKASASGAPWLRSLQANISTASEAPPRPTPARASGPGLSTRRSSRTVPPTERIIIGAIRFEPQRSCSLGTEAGSSSPAHRRRSPCARPRGRRRGCGR